MKRIKAGHLELPISQAKKQIAKTWKRMLTKREIGLEKFKMMKIFRTKIKKNIFIQGLVYKNISFGG